MYVMFLKSRGFKDFKYDMVVMDMDMVDRNTKTKTKTKTKTQTNTMSFQNSLEIYQRFAICLQQAMELNQQDTLECTRR